MVVDSRCCRIKLNHVLSFSCLILIPFVQRSSPKERKRGSEGFTRSLIGQERREASHSCNLTQFFVPHHLSVQKGEKVQLRQKVFRCPHHLKIEPPSNVHSQNGKRPSWVLTTCPKFWGKNRQSTTEVALTSHQKSLSSRILKLTCASNIHKPQYLCGCSSMADPSRRCFFFRDYELLFWLTIKL